MIIGGGDKTIYHQISKKGTCWLKFQNWSWNVAADRRDTARGWGLAVREWDLLELGSGAVLILEVVGVSEAWACRRGIWGFRVRVWKLGIGFLSDSWVVCSLVWFWNNGLGWVLDGWLLDLGWVGWAWARLWVTFFFF